MCGEQSETSSLCGGQSEKPCGCVELSCVCGVLRTCLQSQGGTLWAPQLKCLLPLFKPVNWKFLGGAGGGFGSLIPAERHILGFWPPPQLLNGISRRGKEAAGGWTRRLGQISLMFGLQQERGSGFVWLLFPSWDLGVAPLTASPGQERPWGPVPSSPSLPIKWLPQNRPQGITWITHRSASPRTSGSASHI